MALSYGFYDAINGDRAYNSDQLSRMLDGIISDGIFPKIGTAMAVTASTGNIVLIGEGRSWFNRTWTYNSTSLALTADTSELLLNRIDAVVIEVDTRQQTRANSIKIIKGIPATTPSNPVLTNTGDVHQYAIAYIYRTKASSSIVTANITDNRGTVDCPYVYGVSKSYLTDIDQSKLDGAAIRGGGAIINGNFDIWQRGVSQGISVQGYGSDDRWYNLSYITTKVHEMQSFDIGQTVVPNNPKYYSKTTVTYVESTYSYAYKSQRIIDVRSFAGETIILSFWAKVDGNKNIAIEFEQVFGTGGSNTVQRIGTKKIGVTSVWQKIEAKVDIPSVSGKTIGDNSYLALNIWFTATDAYALRTEGIEKQSGVFGISQVKIEKGIVATRYIPKTYIEELHDCQFYCRRLDGVYIMTYYTYDYLTFAMGDSATNMRIEPTLTRGAENTNFKIFEPNGAPISGISNISMTSGFAIQVYKPAHGKTYGWIRFDAILPPLLDAEI